jgi:thiol-disulfide isomerase/thioredoxin
MFKILAPEFKGIKTWINSKPLKIADLKDKVVLIEFWTHSCKNCRKSMEYLKKWHGKYSKKGLVIIAVHSPEFDFEKKPENVKRIVKENKLKYPIALDSEHKTWNAFENKYWPAKYIIADGFVEYVHFGEGNYEYTEKAIQGFLGVSGPVEKEKFPGYMPDQSPDTYTGFARNAGLGSGLVSDKKGRDFWVMPKEISPNVVYPEGGWEQEKDYLVLKHPPGKITYRFNARKANIVIVPVGKSVKADIFIDFKKKKTMTITSPDMYNVFKSRKYAYRDLGIVFKGKVKVYCFTFE